jgi:hypothetical protein
VTHRQYAIDPADDFIEQFVRTMANWLIPNPDVLPIEYPIEGITDAVLVPVTPSMDSGVLGITVASWQGLDYEMGGRSFMAAQSVYVVNLGHMVVDMDEERMHTVHRQTAKRLRVALETSSPLRVALQHITSTQDNVTEGFLKLQVPEVRFASDELETGSFVALSVTDLHVTTHIR